MSQRWQILLALVLLLVPACSRGDALPVPSVPPPTEKPTLVQPTASTPPAATGAPAQPLAIASPKPSSPLTVDVQLDATRAITQVVTTAGGTMRVTGVDGTRFTLTFPRDALLTDQTITVTPVRTIGNLRLSGKTLVSLQLAPEGLRLLQPAILTIEPPTPIPAQEQISFAYKANGKELHLHPLSPKVSTLTFEVMHFSGVGVGQGNSSDANAISSQPPATAESKAEAAIGDALGDAKRNGGSVADAEPATSKALEDWYKDSVRDNLKDAQGNPDTLDAAMNEFLAWWRNVQLLGQEERFKNQIEEGLKSLAKALKNGFEEAAKNCDVQKMAYRAGPSALLGLEQYEPSMDQAKTLDRMNKCVSFELEIGGTALLKGGKVTFIVDKGTIPLKNTSVSQFESAFKGSGNMPARFDPSPESLSGECSITISNPLMLAADVDAKSTHRDGFFLLDAIFEFKVKASLEWALTQVCPEVAKTIPKMASGPLEFTLEGAGSSWDWVTPGMPNGGIKFTLIRKP